MPQPLRLTDGKLGAVFAAALPLAVKDRDRFLRALAAGLAKQPEVGPGFSSG